LPLRAEVTDLTERLQRLEANASVRRDELTQLEETYRAELDDLDRRAQILADRLVPVVRKTWTRITELERQQGGEPISDEAMEALRRETQREVRRLETSLDERLGEIRDRMETSISNQGRVWLTLVRQLSQLTEDRRVIEQSRAMMRERPPPSDEATNLEALPSLLQPRSRGDPSSPEDDDEDADRSRRRRRVSPR
jgi:dsDNA-specific endonuclease/ATPase MutS2